MKSVLLLGFMSMFLVGSSCPTKKRPPEIPICIHEGEPGGADCVFNDEVYYEKAEDLQGAIVHRPEHYTELINFCFDVSTGAMKGDYSEGEIKYMRKKALEIVEESQ